MARSFAAALVVLALVGCAQAREIPSLKLPAGTARRQLGYEQPASAYGWYHALSLDGAKQTYCGLRDFPPIPDGYGVNRVLCGGSMATYDHYWMWRMDRVGGGSITEVTVGEPVLLSLGQPMLPYCQLPKNRPGLVKCGVQRSQASNFYLEVSDAVVPPGTAFDATARPFYLRAGNWYCTIKGKKNSAYLYCDQPTPTSAFRFPYNGMYSVKLTNQKAGAACSSNFIPLEDGVRSKVNCTKETPAIPSNYPLELFVGLKSVMSTTPGLVSGGQYAFKASDTLYRYQLSVWGVEAGATHPVSQLDNESQNPSQWFVLEKVSGAVAPGSAINTGDRLYLKSALYNKYCGVGASSQIFCDLDEVSPSDTAYVYTIDIKTMA